MIDGCVCCSPYGCPFGAEDLIDGQFPCCICSWCISESEVVLNER